MKLYRQHKLHSGAGGPIVRNPKQAKAIQLSYLRKEGHDIPEKKSMAHEYARVKGSFQQGGTVPETGAYQLHKGEVVFPEMDTRPAGPSPYLKPVPDFNATAPREPRNVSRIVIEGIDDRGKTHGRR